MVIIRVNIILNDEYALHVDIVCLLYRTVSPVIGVRSDQHLDKLPPRDKEESHAVPEPVVETSKREKVVPFEDAEELEPALVR